MKGTRPEVRFREEQTVQGSFEEPVRESVAARAQHRARWVECSGATETQEPALPSQMALYHFRFCTSGSCFSSKSSVCRQALRPSWRR